MNQRPPCPLPASEDQVRVPSGESKENIGFNREEAEAEARQCLSLNMCFGCEVCELLCPDQAIARDPVAQRPRIDLAHCKGCGLCAHFCPRGAITMVPEMDSAS